MEHRHEWSKSTFIVIVILFTLSLFGINNASATQNITVDATNPYSNILQFTAGNHILSFEPEKTYFSSMDKSLSMPLPSTNSLTPKTDVKAHATGTMTQAIRSMPQALKASFSSAVGHNDPAYAIRKTAESFHGLNKRQHLAMDFSTSGVTIRCGNSQWGLRLNKVGYGKDMHAVPLAEPKFTANRVEYSYTGIKEWYENGPLGLEQGFTIDRAQADKKGEGPLTLELSLSGDLTPKMDSDGTRLLLTGSNGANILRYSSLRAVDAKGRQLHTWLELDGLRLLVRVDDSEAQYPVVVDPLIQYQQELLASDGTAGDYFGFSVAVSGDGSTALIGAPGKNSDKGAAYVFAFNGTQWVQQKELTASDGAADDGFGYTVALSNDGNTALITAVGKYAGTGAAYIFTRSGTTWAQKQELFASDGAAGDYFGFVAALNGNGSTALICAPKKYANTNVAQGAAYVFTLSGGTWSQLPELTDPDNVKGNSFASSVTLSGDGNTALINAYNSVTTGMGVYVYALSGTTFALQQELLPPQGDPDSAGPDFGSSLALSNNGNTALTSSAMTFSTQNGNTVYDPGIVYVFTRSGVTWSLQKELTASDGTKKDAFYEVGLSGDGNTALIGAYGKNSGQGAAYVFTLSGGTWSQLPELTAPDGVAGDNFGNSVALNDNGNTALISAPSRNSDQGAVYVYGGSLWTGDIINVANINNVSDTFTIGMDLQQNGAPAANQCSNILKVVDTSNRTAIQQSCVFLDGGTGRHKITLQITGDTTQQGTARDIVNGSFYLCAGAGISAWDLSSCSQISGMPTDFAVYGTTFDISKHAYQFRNGSWNNSLGASGSLTIGNGSNSLMFTNNFFNAASAIQNYLKPSNISEFFEDVGDRSILIGSFGLSLYSQRSDGLCYGMANSAIANYTHREDAAWGIDVFTTANWNIDIVNRWTDVSKVTSPFGVLAPDANIFTAPNLNNLWTIWTIDSAKKIMYYFVAQKAPFQGGQNWVGQDLDQTVLNSDSEDSFINVLTGGSPVSLGFDIKPRGGHEVVVPQMITWDGHRNIMLWDNNFPWGTMPDGYGPYTGIYLDSTANYTQYIPYIQTLQSSGTRETQQTGWTLYRLTFVPSGCGDSQNIYNQWTIPWAPCASSPQAELQTQDNTDATTNYPDPNHIQVLVIGAQVNSVYDQTLSSPVTLIPNGDLVAGQAVQTVSGNGLFTSLYLPVADTYIINATKYAGFAGLEVFVTIPNTDGTVQILNYENLATAVADATQITFTVGLGNNNTGISRTIANDVYNPDYNANLSTVLNPPTNLNAVVNNGGTGVALSWTNTSNPLFASVLVIRKTGSAPSSSTDGTTVYTGAGQSTADTVTANTIYYYAAYSMDGSGNLSAPTIIQLNTGLASIYGTITLTSGGGLSNASVQLLDSNNNVIGVTASTPNGTYAISNIANGSYTLTASHPTAVINSPSSVSVTINGNSQEQDFSATNQETLFLLFNSLSVTVGDTVSIPWAYRNIGNNETVNINLLRNGVPETIASGVPIINGVVSWTVTGPDVSTATLEISLADYPTINAQYTLTIAPSYDFMGTPTSGPTPLAVMFVDESSSATAWLWDFGDGTTSTLQNPVHMYANPGTYTVSETVTVTGGEVVTTKSNYISVTGTCSSLPVTIADTNAYYASLGSALSVVGAGQTLLVQEMNITESPTTTQDVSITLSGGYGCDFSMNPGFTTVHGTLTISQGTVTIDNILIQ